MVGTGTDDTGGGEREEADRRVPWSVNFIQSGVPGVESREVAKGEVSLVSGVTRVPGVPDRGWREWVGGLREETVSGQSLVPRVVWGGLGRYRRRGSVEGWVTPRGGVQRESGSRPGVGTGVEGPLPSSLFRRGRPIPLPGPGSGRARRGCPWR